MNIHHAQLTAFVNTLIDARNDDKIWLGMDAKLQFPSATDLHFFDTHQDALDFQDFNKSIQKDVVLLPVSTTLDFIYESVDADLKSGIEHPNVLLDAEEIILAWEDVKFHHTVNGLTETLDSFDWTKTLYNPVKANTEAESFDDKIQFNRLEQLVEELSAFASESSRGKEAVMQLLERYWKDQPMQTLTQPVLNGEYARNSNLPDYLSNEHTMKKQPIEFLKDNVKFAGFGETLFPELEKNVAESKPEFQLHFQTQIGSRPYDATLYFKKGNDDRYFFNGYKASIELSNGMHREQYIEINNGKGIRAKEAYNLLQGRAIVDRKQLEHLTKEEKEGLAVKPWLQLNFENKTRHGFEIVRFPEDRGYDLKAAVGKFAVQELDGGEKEKEFLSSIERGNAQVATMEKDGKSQHFFIEANPGRKTVNVYDNGFVLQKHENLPKRVQPVAQETARENTQGNMQSNAQKTSKENKQGRGQGKGQRNGKANGAAKKNKRETGIAIQ